MNKMTRLLMIAIMIVLIPISGFAEFQFGMGEIKGYMVGEYYWVINHHNEKPREDMVSGFEGSISRMTTSFLRLSRYVLD